MPRYLAIDYVKLVSVVVSKLIRILNISKLLKPHRQVAYVLIGRHTRIEVFQTNAADT